jgi:hypothetical protein
VADALPLLGGGCCDEQLRDIEGNNTGAPARDSSVHAAAFAFHSLRGIWALHPAMLAPHQH